MKEKAFEFDRRNVSRTYLLLDFEAFENDENIIAAYYTLSIKTLNFSHGVSKRMIKDIDGFSKEAESVSAVLIGQLGKDVVNGKDLRGADILSSAIGMAYEVSSIAGSRIVFLECEPIDKLLAFYDTNGFVRLQDNRKTGLVQMVRFL